MNPLRIVFMGTPDFSVPTLEALVAGPHQVVGVYCQPDKQKGRGKQIQIPPVKEAALAHNIPVYQPVTLKDDAVRAELEALAPDLIVVVAYGKILPSWLIHLPPYSCLNVHASILPKYRGAAPIHYAIINGDAETGVTIMRMDEGLDTGDILSIISTSIQEEETTGQLFERLSYMGAQVINETIDDWVAGRIEPRQQNPQEVSHTQKITKEMGRLDWSQPAHHLACWIRGLNPAPGCYTFLDGKRVKVWMARVRNDESFDKAGDSPVCGTIVGLGKHSIDVLTGRGVLQLIQVQPDNKKRMDAGDFSRGHQLTVGQVFTNE